MKSNSQQGSVHVVITICLVVALIFALGWIFWQNFIHKEATKKDTELVVIDKTKRDNKPADTSIKAFTPVYHDFRTKGDTTGLEIKTAADVDKITDAGADLKAYFIANVGKTIETMDGMQTRIYEVDQVYGNYATGTQTGGGAYLVWGPKNGTGVITNVAGTQNDAFGCSELKAAKVPHQLVNGKCNYFGSDGNVITEKY